MDLLSMSIEEIAEHFPDEPKFRAEQIFSWVSKGVQSPDEMKNLPKPLREKLVFTHPKIAKRQISSDQTEKLLFELSDKQYVESVLLRYDTGYTLCISSQVGCRQGCAFCASTIGGKIRDLTAGEMLGQVLYCGRELQNIVIMGIGEPLDNLENTLKFLKLLTHPKGLGMSLRRVTVSTCGLVPEILKLAEEDLPVTLSVSLHAPDDETRNMLMPINKKYGIDKLVHSAKIYFDKTGRRTSYEYILIKGVNDSDFHARKLADLLKNQGVHINLIPFNKVEGKSFEPSDNVKSFAAILEQAGLNITIRRKLGADIDAACGQLRRKSAET